VVDDTALFMKSLSCGESVVVLVSSSIVSNFPDTYKHIFGWLRSLGVLAIFDEGFGAELTHKSYEELLKTYQAPLLIAQPCPVVVTYIELYLPELLPYLAPVGSPLHHAVVAVRKFDERFERAKVVSITPCAAKRREFEESGVGDYVVTFKTLQKFIECECIDLSQFPESDFDLPPMKSHTHFPNSGELLKNIFRQVEDSGKRTRRVEGMSSVYRYLKMLPQVLSDKKNPFLVECSSCESGCGVGAGSVAFRSVCDEHDWRIAQHVEIQNARVDQLHADANQLTVEKYWQPESYIRTYRDLSANIRLSYPDENEIQDIFRNKLSKTEFCDESNCRSCGFNSCRDMAVAIYNDLMPTNNCYIAQRKHLAVREVEVVEHTGLLRGILDVASEGFVAFSNNQNCVTHVNDRFLEIWGFERDQIIGMTSYELHNLLFMRMVDPCPFRSALLEFTTMLQPKNGVSELMDGRMILWQSRAAQIKGDEVLRVWSYQDITDQERAFNEVREYRDHLEHLVELRTNELSLAKEAAEAGSRAKSDFLANMSHEIRTPLNGVIGLSDLLLRSELQEKQQHLVNLVRSSGESLLFLINDILDFSKIEAGKLELAHDSFNLHKVINSAIGILASRAVAKGLEICYTRRDPIPHKVIGDENRLRQVILNIIGNAIKFTDKGGVLIHAKTLKIESGRVNIQVEIVDTGIGIAPSSVSRLFHTFSQADSSTSRTHGGTGLGLVISQNLVRMMGGDIHFSSVEGSGTKFWFDVWFDVERGEDFGVDSKSSLELVAESFFDVESGDFSDVEELLRPHELFGGRFAVVVDDSELQREAFCDQLVNWGMETVSCQDKDEVTGLLRSRFESKLPVDLVLIDTSIVGGSGMDLICELREVGLLDGVAVILMLGLDEMAEFSDRSDSFTVVPKPVSCSSLFERVLGVFYRDKLHAGKQKIDVVKTTKQIRQLASGFRILVAEDNRINQIVVSGILQEAGQSCDIVQNGEEAYKAFLSEKYDLILMDCQMPGVDGYEATGMIRKSEKERGVARIPIIALTANAVSGDEKKCIDAGMDAYCSKPINPNLLIDKIANMLEKVQSTP
jgi:signal transduction histidine kinase/CheY-like chemotaxis protein